MCAALITSPALFEARRLLNRLFSAAATSSCAAGRVGRVNCGTRVALVDVREPWEWSLCHLEGAQHIPMGEIPVRHLELDPADEVVVYCRIGERSSHTWFALTHLLGYEHVRNYDGSWTEWGSLVGAPIEK